MSVVFVIFFFSSRRRHTRSLRDWSSDVCSSDLCGMAESRANIEALCAAKGMRMTRSEERRVGKSVDLGGRRIIKKKKKKQEKKKQLYRLKKKKTIKRNRQ